MLQSSQQSINKNIVLELDARGLLNAISEIYSWEISNEAYMTRRNVLPAQKIQQDSSIAIYHTFRNYSACHSTFKHNIFSAVQNNIL